MSFLWVFANIISISAAFRVIQPKQPSAAKSNVTQDPFMNVTVSLPFAGEAAAAASSFTLPRQATIGDLRSLLGQQLNASKFGTDNFWLVRSNARGVLPDLQPVGAEQKFTAVLFQYKDMKSLVQSGVHNEFQVLLEGWNSTAGACRDADLAVHGSKSGILLSTPKELGNLLPMLLTSQATSPWSCVQGLPEPEWLCDNAALLQAARSNKCSGSRTTNCCRMRNYGSFTVTAINGRPVSAAEPSAPLLAYVRPNDPQQDGRTIISVSWARTAAPAA